MPATKFAAQEYRARVTSPADRDAIIEVLRRYMIHHRIPEAADALLARGLRLPGDETMAWAVVDPVAGVRSVFMYERAAQLDAQEGDTIRRVELSWRVVEGGDDAA